MKKISSKKCILVVEDESVLRKSLVSALEDAKFKVLEAENGKKGLEIALKNKPDLILLDLLMPVMDGWTMLKHLRKDKWGKNVFVFILTNSEPSAQMNDEASHIPYRSAYIMKVDCDLGEIVKLATEKTSKMTLNKIK
jgi:CheY-like chemotaxis protein